MRKDVDPLGPAGLKPVFGNGGLYAAMNGRSSTLKSVFDGAIR